MQYKFPENTPKFVREALRETLSGVHSILQRKLIGIYLCGSLAMGCFQPGSSDIDLILVTKEKPTKKESGRIIQYLKRTCSKDRRVELSIVAEETLHDPQYPMLVDLHFEYWGGIFERQRDNEILSNLYTTKERGFCIWGEPISHVFRMIPMQYHIRSTKEDIEHTIKHLHETPEHTGYDVAVYWVLSSCRILAFIRERKVLSKLEGGQWGLANLPKEYHDLIEQALSCYGGKKKGDIIREHKELDAFADYMTNTITEESRRLTTSEARPPPS